MNNRSLVNLKQRNPLTGESLVMADSHFRPSIVGTLGWHTYSRLRIAVLVLKVKQAESDGMPARSHIQSIRDWFKGRHTAPKGWKK